MKEIVIVSGKGGTGKTSFTASFAVLAQKEIIAVDCDVDAADMHLLLEPDFAESEDFYNGELAVIDQEKCIACGECAQVCRFDAISIIHGQYNVDEIGCEGCGYCARICSVEAITNIEQKVGQWYKSTLRTGSTMIHARLNIGADNSGKLVTKVKNEAKAAAVLEGKKIILVDGSPGIGCPVVSSLSGASLAVLVTEPTLSGLHDLKRVHQLIKTFGLPSGCIINKSDLNANVLEDLKNFLHKEGIVNLAEFAYNEDFTAAITNAQTIVEWDQELARSVGQCWFKIKQLAEAT